MSTCELRELMKSTASSAGMSIPSDRQRGVGEYPTSVWRIAFEPIDPGLSVEGMMLPVDMTYFAAECAPAFPLGQHFDGLLDYVIPEPFKPLR